MKQYLFICGCPRSGTTAFWRLLIHHSDVFIGNERYIFKAFSQYSLKPYLYGKDKFFQYNKLETHFENILEGPPGQYYQKNINKHYQKKYIGDKIPTLYRYFDNLDNTFEKPKVIVLVRNIFDVANSYKKRLVNPNDGWNLSVKEAIKDWNESLEAVNSRSMNPNYLIINFDTFFSGKQNSAINSIYKFLPLLLKNDSLNKRYAIEKKFFLSFCEKKEYILNHDEISLISSEANFRLYQEIIRNII